MKQHEFLPGATACKWCGALYPATQCECLDRTSALRPEPVRRVYACEDIDAIATRIAELGKEHAEMMSRQDTK